MQRKHPDSKYGNRKTVVEEAANRSCLQLLTLTLYTLFSPQLLGTSASFWEPDHVLEQNEDAQLTSYSCSPGKLFAGRGGSIHSSNRSSN